MVLFGIRLNDNGISRSYIKRTNEKLGSTDYDKIALEGYALPVNKDEKFFMLIKAGLIFGNSPFVYSFMVLLGVMFIFNLFNYWLLSIASMLLFLILGMKYVWFLIIMFRLKKNGYKGKFKLLNNSALMEELGQWVKEKS